MHVDAEIFKENNTFYCFFRGFVGYCSFKYVGSVLEQTEYMSEKWYFYFEQLK